MDSSLFEVDANPTAKTAPYTSLLNQIKSAYRDANVGVKEGGTVRVGTKTYAVEIIDTKTASALTQCTYLMPETDCRILFGVCDPVMCPVSRFNLGGTWDVGPSVVQSGIIGSIVLGLPNFNIPYEPVPVCLTGIHAGLENIYSMLGSYRDCLETAKIKGESVGICNEIRSIYICDILWQEGLALFNTFGNLRNIIGTNLFGSGASGEIGLDWENSWDQLSNNVNFFTKQYANEAFAAFNARSTQEIGSEICKVAIFGKNPAGGNLLSQLTEPESPPQFTGWFEEQVTTSVDRTGILDGSVPPSYGTGQSAYRIYYHIYAGRNTDVRYRVYLTDAVGNRLPVTDESGFSLGGTRYLKKGNSVDKSFVITGMEPGFTQMCIEINGASSCGFGSVTSSFSMQYLKEQLIKNELEKEDIKTKEDCVPDEPYYKPGLIQNGIKRVCSVYDPDGVSAEWVVVGSCGYDEKDRFIGDCYLYTKDLDFYDLTYNLQGTVANISKQYLQNQTQVTQEDITEAKQRLEELKTTEQSSTSEQKINKIIPEYRKLIAWDIDRDINAESYYRIAEIYRTLANGQIQLEVSSTVTPTENTGLGFSDLPSLMNYLTTNTLGNRLCSCGENCEDYANWILKYSNEYGINPLLVLSVIMQESQCAADSCGPDGCTGLMQIEPTTAAELCGVTDVDSQLNGVSNAEANIECGIKVLKEKYDIYKDGAKSITCQTEPARTKYTSYTGWQAALRGYNGWGCAANVNTNYVEEVWERYLGITSLYNGEYSIYINNVASEYTTDLTRPEDGNCETEGEQSCDAWTSCYVKKEKFLIDELKSDSCKDCANLKTCPDIKNKDKCNDKSCASLAGLSCEWSDDKGVCANII